MSRTFVRPSKWDEYELIGPWVKLGTVDRNAPTYRHVVGARHWVETIDDSSVIRCVGTRMVRRTYDGRAAFR
jgi:hypothetical protein